MIQGGLAEETQGLGGTPLREGILVPHAACQGRSTRNTQAPESLRSSPLNESIGIAHLSRQGVGVRPGCRTYATERIGRFYASSGISAFKLFNEPTYKRGRALAYLSKGCRCVPTDLSVLVSNAVRQRFSVRCRGLAEPSQSPSSTHSYSGILMIEPNRKLGTVRHSTPSYTSSAKRFCSAKSHIAIAAVQWTSSMRSRCTQGRGADLTE